MGKSATRCKHIEGHYATQTQYFHSWLIKRGEGHETMVLVSALPPRPRRHRMRIGPQAFLGLSRLCLKLL